MQTENISRREFLKRAILGATVLTAPPSLLVSYTRSVFAEPVSSSHKSRVAVVTHSKSVDAGGSIDPDITRTMMREGVKAIIGKDSVQNAWLSLFPGLKSTDIIGIKLNCVNPRFPSHKEVVNAIIAELKHIGIADNNIIVWDRTDWELNRCGYKINASSTGVRYLGTWLYDDRIIIRTFEKRKSGTLLSTILTRQCDYLINVPVLKDHSIAGVTLSMKNHYGTISNPALHHSNNCDPNVAYINASNPIREKTKLIVLDALLGIYSGGPGGSPQWVNRQLLIGTDPVAIDYEGMMIIEEKRLSKGRSSIIRKSRYIQTAARLGVGTNNPEQINLQLLGLG